MQMFSDVGFDLKYSLLIYLCKSLRLLYCDKESFMQYLSWLTNTQAVDVSDLEVF